MGFGKEKTTYYLDVCRETGKLQHKPEGRETYHKYDYVEGSFTGLWTRESVLLKNRWVMQK